MNQMEERTKAIQVLAFSTEIAQRGYFDIVGQRPKLAMTDAPSPASTLLEGDHHCGVLYDDIDWLRSAIDPAAVHSFILLSRTDAAPDSQDFFFDTAVYENRPNCLLNIMLVKERYSSVFTAVDRILQRGTKSAATPVTPVFERVAIGQIHEDAWKRAKSYLWQVFLS